MRLKEKGFKWRGYELGQIIYVKKYNVYCKIIGLDTETTSDTFIVVECIDNDFPIKNSNFIKEIVILDGYKESGYLWISERYVIGNYFKTKEDAEKYLDKFERLFKEEL